MLNNIAAALVAHEGTAFVFTVHSGEPIVTGVVPVAPGETLLVQHVGDEAGFTKIIFTGLPRGGGVVLTDNIRPDGTYIQTLTQVGPIQQLECVPPGFGFYVIGVHPAG